MTEAQKRSEMLALIGGIVAMANRDSHKPGAYHPKLSMPPTDDQITEAFLSIVDGARMLSDGFDLFGGLIALISGDQAEAQDRAKKRLFDLLMNKVSSQQAQIYAEILDYGGLRNSLELAMLTRAELADPKPAPAAPAVKTAGENGQG